jgi:AbrB family looped-hinge helix DNA binding protein
MQVSIDKFGRVLIPKAIRDHLGIKSGTTMQIMEQDHEILLKLVESQPPLRHEGSILVFTGEATGDIESAIYAERENRLKDLF